MRRFLPARGGGGEPSSSSSSGGHQRRELAGEAGLRYDGGGDISLGHGHDAGGGHRRHHHHQLGGGGGGQAAERQQQDDGSMDMLARHSSSPAGFFSNLVVDNGYPGSKGAGGSGGAEASGSGRKMKPSQFNFTRPQPGGAAGHLSQISEDGAFPPGLVGDRAGESSSSGGGAAAARSFSGGFSIVGPWEESRDIIATLGAYDSQVLASLYLAAPWRARRWRWRAWTGTCSCSQTRCRSKCAPSAGAPRTPGASPRGSGGRGSARSSGSCRSLCPTWTSKRAPPTCWTLQWSTSRACRANCRL
nr:uncharacterized PE-PGRS family protein PE_PGRS54-like isoform X2 [Setaria viridis]